MSRLVQDIQLALRGFRHSPAFAATVVLILALGIGMTAAMLTVSNAVLWRRLPVHDQDRLVVLWGVGEGAETQLQLRLTQYERFRAASRTLREATAVPHWGVVAYPIGDGERTLPLRHALVPGNFFHTLGSTPVLGRPLQPADDVVGAEPVMVISHNLWRQQFAGDPNIIGRRLKMRGFHGWTYTIVGVAPAGLDYPAGADIWVPVVPFTTFAGESYVSVFVVGRLAPGATPTAARDELLNFLRRTDEAPSNLARPVGAAVRTLSGMVVGTVRPALLVLTAAATLLLLAACLNVGNLMLLRAQGRTREIGIRRALGAGYREIVRQVFLESTLLAAAGGVLGLLLAFGLLRALVVVAPAELPRLDMIRLEGVPVTIAAAVTLVAVLLFGLGPAIGAARIDPASLLRSGSRAETRTRRGVRQALVGGQIALAFVVLVGAGLLTRSLARLQRLDLGFSGDHVSLIQLSLPLRLASDQRALLTLHEEVEAKIRALPGVSGITPLFVPPFVGEAFNVELVVEGHPELGGAANVSMESVGSDYFMTLGVPIRRGRGFTDADRAGAVKVVVVSESVARRFWPGENPIGQGVRMPGDTGVAGLRTVVGVAEDTRYRKFREITPTVYFPYRQFGAQGVFAVRTAGDLSGVLPAMRRAVQEAEPEAYLWKADTMDQLLTGPLAQTRLSALLLTGFSLTTVLLGAIGLYGIMASAVRERTREIGVRMALGAAPARLRRGVLGQALLIAGVGMVVGTLGALAGSRVLTSMLFEVSPADPASLLGSGALLIVVAFLAAYVPARRATRIDPVQALRAE